MSASITTKLVKRLRRFFQNREAEKLLAKTRKKAELQSKTLVHFLHIGKTGGTAVKQALGRFPESYINDNFVVLCHPHSFRLKDSLNGEKVFFFVRDPIARFVSGFYSRQRKGLPRAYHEWSIGEKLAFGSFNTPNELAVALSSGDAEQRKMAEKAMKSIGHVNTSYWDWFDNEKAFLERKTDIIFIGRQESLDQDFATLKEVLGIRENLELPKDEVKAHKNPADVDKSLSDTAIQNLWEWFAEDYRFLELLRNNGLL